MKRILLAIALLVAPTRVFAQGQIQPAGSGSGGSSGVVKQGAVDGTAQAWHITCDSGCGSPPATPDNATFTAGTTNVSLGAGVFNDGLSALASGKSGAPRITAYRAWHMNLRDASGNEIATSGAPLYVVFPSAQAVTQSGTWNVGTLTSITNAVAVTGTFWQATQPVSGPLTDTQLRASNVNVAVNAALPTGSNTIGAISNTAFTANAGTNLNTSALALEATQLTGNTSLASIKTNTDPLVTAAAGGYVRQDSTATIARESGGNLASVKTNTDKLDINVSALRDAITAAGASAKTLADLYTVLSTLATAAAQTDRTQKTQITDGTRDGTVKAASTLPLTTDTAVVVTTRDTVTSQWTNPAVSSGTLTTTTCPGTGCLAVSSLTQASLATVGVTGTFTGAAVVTFEISEDGTNWVGTTCAQASTANYISSFSPTTGGYEIIACPLYGQISDFRVRMTLAPGTGSVVVRATVSSDPIPSPANTAKQGTGGSSGGTSWYMKVTDNSFNGPASVKPASTAAVAADPALVVATSPNTPLPAGTNAIGSVTIQGIDATGTKQTIATTTSGIQFVQVSPAPALPLPPCNAVRRTACSPKGY